MQLLAEICVCVYIQENSKTRVVLEPNPGLVYCVRAVVTVSPPSKADHMKVQTQVLFQGCKYIYEGLNLMRKRFCKWCLALWTPWLENPTLRPRSAHLNRNPNQENMPQDPENDSFDTYHTLDRKTFGLHGCPISSFPGGVA